MRQVFTPLSLPVTDFLPLLLASAGPWLLGLPFPPPTCSQELAAMGRLISPPSTVSCFPALSHTEGLALLLGITVPFFLLLNEFSIPHHGQFSSFSSWSVQSSASTLCASEGQSTDGAHGAALPSATACTQLLSLLPLCFSPGSCAIPALPAARVCNHKVLLEK